MKFSWNEFASLQGGDHRFIAFVSIKERQMTDSQSESRADLNVIRRAIDLDAIGYSRKCEMTDAMSVEAPARLRSEFRRENIIREKNAENRYKSDSFKKRKTCWKRRKTNLGMQWLHILVAFFLSLIIWVKRKELRINQLKKKKGSVSFQEEK